MTDNYGEIYGKIKSQRAIVEERRKQLGKPVVSGTAKQRRILMRRVRKTPEHRDYVKAKEERLVALGEAEVEIGEYESKIREYEEEGYEVEPTDEGHRFTKQVYVPGERVLVQREVSVMVYWRNPRTGKTGRFQGRQSQIADYERQLGATGRQITSVTTIGGGPAYETTEGHWTTEDVVLAEAKPVYTQVKGEVDWAKIKTDYPQVGFLLEYADPRQQRLLQKAITSRYPEKVREVQFRLATTAAFKSLTEPEKISYAEQYYKFGKEEKPWSEFKESDWELKVKEEKITVATPLTDTKILFKAMAKEYKKSPGIFGYVRAGTIAFTSWFRPETWVAGFKGGGPLSGGMLGVQPRIGYGAAVETLKWEYPITKMKDPLHKFVAVARPAYETVVLPYVGGALLGKAGAIFRGAKTIWSPGTKIVLGGTKVVVAGAMSTVIGADIGYTAAMERHGFLESGTLAAKISKYTVQFAFIGAGYKVGAALKPGVITTKFRAVIDKAFPYRADLRFMKHYDPFTYKHGMFPGKTPKGIRPFRLGDRELYLYGRRGMVSGREGLTTLEQTMYKPGDPFMSYRAGGVWGAYETSWGLYRQTLMGEGIFVLPKPLTIKTVTFGFRYDQDPLKGFFIKKGIGISKKFVTYETTPMTVKVAGKDYRFSLFTGETTIKGLPKRVIGFGSGKYIKDITPDIIATRTYGYSVADMGRPTIIRGIALSKTYYGGETSWTGDKIKFFTTGKEIESTIGFAYGRTRMGNILQDVSRIVKPSTQIKTYFGETGGFDYQGITAKPVTDVVMPGGIQTDTGVQIRLPSTFDTMKTKQIFHVDYDTGAISDYWKGVIPRAKPISITADMQKIGIASMMDTKQISTNINREIRKQIPMQISIPKVDTLSLSAYETISSSLTKQLQIQRQIQKQIQKQQLKQITITSQIFTPLMFPPTTRPSLVYATEITPTPIIPKVPLPIAWFDLPEAEPRKRRKKKEEFDDWGLGYRFRRWKVPTMKQIIGMEM